MSIEVATSSCVDGSRASSHRPNIVFVVLDDARFDDFGFSGHPFVKTPNFDRVAMEGVQFSNAFAPVPLCSPNRACILTGLYAHSHGITDNTDRSERSHQLETFPRLLNRAGYETAFIGKWHMGLDDTRRPGFDEWVCMRGQGDYFDPEVNDNGQRRRLAGYASDIFSEGSISGMYAFCSLFGIIALDTGGSVPMTNQSFQSWLAGLDRLSAAQWSQLQQAVQERSEGAAAVAAIELQIDTERRCPHCQAGGAVRRGTTRGLRRYSCKRCGKTFNALSGTALSGLHHKERWLALGRSLVERESVRRSAQRCGVAVTTAFRWRHRFLQQAGQLAGPLEGLVEADETYVLHSQKGERKLPRKARRRGGRARKRGLSKEQVPVLLATARGGATVGQALESVTQASLQAALAPVLASDAVLVSDGGRAYPGCARRLGVQHEAVNVSAGRRVRGSYHIQTVNNRHQQWKAFLGPFRGVATKYLDSYLRWFQGVGLVREASPRSCLVASMTPRCIRFAN